MPSYMRDRTLHAHLDRHETVPRSEPSLQKWIPSDGLPPPT